MDPRLYTARGHVRSSSDRLASWESFLAQQKHAQQDATMLEYETLALRLDPPNVMIDNDFYDDRTVLTIDSANRPGTLVEVVQCLTELGLSVKQARISSDGGWFVDEFHVSETPSGRVTDPKKLDAIRKVLALPEAAGEAPELHTVFQIAGPEVPGLLADITELLTHNGLEIRTAACWTHAGRAAAVLGVTERRAAVCDAVKLARLQQLLSRLVDKGGDAAVSVEQVDGPVHHERRLHQLMLADEIHAWKQLRRLQRQHSLPFPGPNPIATQPRGGSSSGGGGDVDAEPDQQPHTPRTPQQQWQRRMLPPDWTVDAAGKPVIKEEVLQQVAAQQRRELQAQQQRERDQQQREQQQKEQQHLQQQQQQQSQGRGAFADAPSSSSVTPAAGAASVGGVACSQADALQGQQGAAHAPAGPDSNGSSTGSSTGSSNSSAPAAATAAAAQAASEGQAGASQQAPASQEAAAAADVFKGGRRSSFDAVMPSTLQLGSAQVPPLFRTVSAAAAPGGGLPPRAPTLPPAMPGNTAAGGSSSSSSSAPCSPLHPSRAGAAAAHWSPGRFASAAAAAGQLSPRALPRAVSSDASLGGAWPLAQQLQAQPPPPPGQDTPEVHIRNSSLFGYWLVEIKCRDRNKLFFDTVCTLCDMRYDIFHATIDGEASGWASQLFYVRPRFGDAAFDASKASVLQAMLVSAVQRRFPQGQRVHVFCGSSVSLQELVTAMRRHKLSITRCKVRAYENASHTFYVLHGDGSAPSRQYVSMVCQSAGGELVEAPLDCANPAVAHVLRSLDARGRFAFSFYSKRGGLSARGGGGGGLPGQQPMAGSVAALLGAQQQHGYFDAAAAAAGGGGGGVAGVMAGSGGGGGDQSVHGPRRGGSGALLGLGQLHAGAGAGHAAAAAAAVHHRRAPLEGGSYQSDGTQPSF